MDDIAFGGKVSPRQPKSRTSFGRKDDSHLNNLFAIINEKITFRFTPTRSMLFEHTQEMNFEEL
jgi:hypothetical protein